MSEALDLAQATILGRLMEHNDEAANTFGRVSIDDFAGEYRHICTAIHSLWANKATFGPASVMAEIERQVAPVSYAEVMRVNGFGFGDAEFQIDYLANLSRLRRLEVLGIRTQQAAVGSDADAQQVAATLLERTQQIIHGLEAEGEVTTMTAREFLDVTDAPYDWVIPGLLERGDRLILTGKEGLGKSFLLRQIAVCAAAGLDPFTRLRIEPQKVLIVDCENGATKIRRALRPLMTQARKFSKTADTNLFIESRPEGLDLTRPEDELWLVRRVNALQPALLLTGPIYRLHSKDPNEEKPARDVTRVLDRCRAVANCALVTEAHAGHGSALNGKERPVRPTGTSLWLRWPEFGYGLRPTDDYNNDGRLVDFVPWRGDREERNWPRRLQSGGDWPWERAIHPDEIPWSPSRQARDTA